MYDVQRVGLCFIRMRFSVDAAFHADVAFHADAAFHAEVSSWQMLVAHAAHKGTCAVQKQHVSEPIVNDDG